MRCKVRIDRTMHRELKTNTSIVNLFVACLCNQLSIAQQVNMQLLLLCCYRTTAKANAKANASAVLGTDQRHIDFIVSVGPSTFFFAPFIQLDFMFTTFSRRCLSVVCNPATKLASSVRTIQTSSRTMGVDVIQISAGDGK